MTDRERELEGRCAALREALAKCRFSLATCMGPLVEWDDAHTFPEIIDSKQTLAVVDAALSLTSSTAATYTARIRAEERERIAFLVGNCNGVSKAKQLAVFIRALGDAPNPELFAPSPAQRSRNGCV